MNLNEYQKLANRTCASFEQSVMLQHGCYGLASESGEVTGIMQKTFQGHIFDREHMIKELGDCMWMIAEIATAIDTTLDEIATTNIEKLKKRYPEGFDEERSLHRSSEDI